VRDLDEELERGNRAAYDLAACVCEAGAACGAWVIPMGQSRYVVVVELERAGQRVAEPSLGSIGDESVLIGGRRLAAAVADHLDAMGAGVTFWNFPAEEDDVFYVYVEATGDDAATAGDAPQARALRFAPDGTMKPYLGDD
jgi:hypothetical protein